jgi:site-specific DNA-adenine methylase
MGDKMKAPFPYFGGKAPVAAIVWSALGNPKHYLEPFFGSGAVLLNRPDYNPALHMETVCDKDGNLCNVWRAMQAEPDRLAALCDWPVNHADLMARRRVMIKEQGELLEKLIQDAEYYDLKLAGYWIWAASCWIGSGLTRPNAIPELSRGKGINKDSVAGKRPDIQHSGGSGIHAFPEQIPILTEKGMVGINAKGQIPELRDGRGINNDQIPYLTHDNGVCRRPEVSCGHGVHKYSITGEPEPALDVREPYTPGLYSWFRELSERLRRVRVVCGDWSRICGGDWQDDRGTCGIFMDPPYGEAAGRDAKIYHEDSLEVAGEVQDWVLQRGERRSYRIVLAGYIEEHQTLLDQNWSVYRWSTNGGYANRGKGEGPGSENRHREALFFSPHCFSSGLKRFFDAGEL